MLTVASSSLRPLDAAYDRCQRYGQASLADIRRELALPRAAADRLIALGRRTGLYFLEQAESVLSEAERAAAVVEDGQTLCYIGRRA